MEFSNARLNNPVSCYVENDQVELDDIPAVPSAARQFQTGFLGIKDLVAKL